ncbi:PIEZ1 protein, partial [Anthoscopus minutus]|nr:PIEZ1 protein [Anthoscopus minutus]
EEPRAGRPSAFQLAYQAWVTNTRTVLRQQEQPEQPQPPSTESAAERSNALQRALNTLRFLWLLCQALVDGLTQWLDTCTQEHTDMSRILCLERCVMAQRLARGEEINHKFPDELYELPLEEEFPQELGPSDSQSSASRQGALPCPCVILRATPSSCSQEQVTSLGSQEDMAESQQSLAVFPQRRRTASELLKSRWAWGQRDR